MSINIAIDGHSSCGKSTLAKQLAEALGYRYIDSGAMYRAITLFLIRHNISASDEEAVGNALQQIKLDWEINGEITLNGAPVGRYIRDLIVADKVSQVAAIKKVRAFAVAQQQAMGMEKGVVMDGRDIGTIVFPNAALKIFLTADPLIRVKRRFLELAKGNNEVSMEDVRHNLELRDYIDSNRSESPLTKAEDARILDNSDLDKEAQLKKVLHWAREAIFISEVPSS